LALCGDLTLVAPDVSIGYPEMQDGVIPAVVMPSAVRSVGRQMAFRLLFAGHRLTAEQAVDAGVATEVATRSELTERALRLCDRWGAATGDDLREAKKLLLRLEEATPEEALNAGIAVTAATWRPPT
jgi:enoyl-CoA hydratase/carnithine racemase